MSFYKIGLLTVRSRLRILPNSNISINSDLLTETSKGILLSEFGNSMQKFFQGY